MWIENAFPGLSSGRYTITSGPTDDYNCIAWAVGETSVWWSHAPGYRWIGQRTPNVESLIALFTTIGYKACENPSMEEGYDKIAVYQKDGLWTHASRQLSNGRWTSKLGPDEDIEHESANLLAGDFYGTVHCIMRKRRI